jgi:hypothetical protein
MKSSVKEEIQLQPIAAASSGTFLNPGKLNEEGTHILLSPAGITKWFIYLVLLLLVGHVFIVHLANKLLPYLKNTAHYEGFKAFYWALYNQFSLAQDSNIPTYFSSVLLAIASLLLLVIHLTKESKTYHWVSLSLLFLFLSIDEATQLHETFGGLVGNKVNTYIKEPPAFLKWAWMVPYSALTLIAGLYYFTFIWRLPVKTRKLFIISGFIYVLAALFLEFFESHFQITYGSGNLPNAFLYPIEETLEMLGVVLFIYALLDYIKAHHPQFWIHTR